MSDILTINTGENIVKEEPITPLPLYDENHPMLKVDIPEYKSPLPNKIMTNLVERLKLTMRMYNGVGLSANQCGVHERVFVIGTDYFQMACINPKVIEQSPDLIKENEGCLSFPGLWLKVERPSWIVAEFTDETGATKQMRLEGITAKCFLHELDHMNGIRFVDKVKPVALQMARDKQKKLIKKVMRRTK